MIDNTIRAMTTAANHDPDCPYLLDSDDTCECSDHEATEGTTMRKTTKRYVVAPGVEADLCNRCWLAPVDIARDLDAVEREARAVSLENDGDDGIVLSHERYLAIHPHREQS